MTPYTPGNADYSRACHLNHRGLIYGSLFGCSPDEIRWDDREGTPDDLSLGIDRVAHVRAMRGEIPHTIQERFRPLSFASHREVTITEFNSMTRHLSEIYKCRAQWFVYGYFSADASEILEVIALPTPTFFNAIARRAIPYTTMVSAGKGQHFLCVKIDDIVDMRLADLHIRGSDVVFDRLEEIDAAEGEPDAPAMMPPILFVDDVTAFWRNYYIRTPEEWEAARR